MSTQKSFYSTVTKSDYPYIGPEDFSARYSRSPEKDSTSTNYVRLARKTKHQLIMERINKKKKKIVQKSRKEKEKQRMMIVKRRNKILEDNRRKMMEVQWRLKLAKISTHIHKDKIKNIRWKIGGNWSNTKVKSVTRRASNFEERNYIWRTTKNVRYTISKADLNKIPKEEIYETEDTEGNRKLVRKRIIQSRAKTRMKNDARSIKSRGNPRKWRLSVKGRKGQHNKEVTPSKVDDSSFFIPETPKNEYEDYLNKGDTIEEDESHSIIHSKKKKRRRINNRKYPLNSDIKIEESTKHIMKSPKSHKVLPKAIYSVPGGGKKPKKKKRKKKKGRTSRTVLHSRSKKRVIKGKKRSKLKGRVGTSSISVRSRKYSRIGRGSKSNISRSRGSKYRSVNSRKSKSRRRKNKKKKKKKNRRGNNNEISSSTLNRSFYSRNSYKLDKSRSTSALPPRVKPGDRVYIFPLDYPAPSQTLYDDDGDDPVANRNPLEIYHPSEDPEIESIPLLPLHYRPNFVTDNPKNYMGIESSSYKISEKSKFEAEEEEKESVKEAEKENVKETEGLKPEKKKVVKMKTDISGATGDIYMVNKMKSTFYDMGDSQPNILGQGYKPVYRKKEEGEEEQEEGDK